MTDVHTLTRPGRELADDALDRVRELGGTSRELAGDAVGYVKERSTLKRLLVALAAGIVAGVLVTAVVASRRQDEDEAGAGADDASETDAARARTA